MNKKKVLKIVLISAVSLLVVAGIVFGVFMFTSIKNAERWAFVENRLAKKEESICIRVLGGYWRWRWYRLY